MPTKYILDTKVKEIAGLTVVVDIDGYITPDREVEYTDYSVYEMEGEANLTELFIKDKGAFITIHDYMLKEADSLPLHDREYV